MATDIYQPYQLGGLWFSEGMALETASTFSVVLGADRPPARQPEIHHSPVVDATPRCPYCGRKDIDGLAICLGCNGVL